MSVSPSRPKTLLLLGASVRAAAWSCRLAGIQPLAIDIFGDQDLLALAPWLGSTKYPHDLPRLARECKADAWMYTGGLENYPRVLNRIGEGLALLGNSGPIVHRVRDPWMLAAALRQEGIDVPHIAPRDTTPPVDGTWLIKNQRGSGGAHVAFLHNPNARPTLRRSHYFQQMIPGIPVSAVFIANGKDACFIGSCLQELTSRPGGGPFCYAGSIGPVSLDEQTRQNWDRIGHALSRRFSLQGIFGVDAVLQEEKLHVIEVNPRYTASVEVLERGIQRSLIMEHIKGCVGDPLDKWNTAEESVLHGKRIHYAEHRTKITRAAITWMREQWQSSPFPRLADVPGEGTVVEVGHPLATVFGMGRTIPEVQAALDEQTSRLRRALT